MSANGLLVWSTSGATVALVVQGGIVVETPPYAHRWAYGRSARDLWYEGRRRGVDLTWIPQSEETVCRHTTYLSRFDRPPTSST